MNSAVPSRPWTSRQIGDLGATEFRKVHPFSSPDEQFEYYSIPAYQNRKTAELTRGRDILSQKTVIPSRCVLFGKLNPRVEKVWNVKSSGPFRCIASTEWLPIVPKEGIDQDWLYFLMYSQWVMPVAQTLVTGSTPSRQRVDPQSFYGITTPVPGFGEQQAIAGILTLFDNAVRHQTEEIRLLGNLKRAAMRTLFVRGLRGEEQKVTEIGPVPESWEQTTLGTLCDGPGGAIQTGPFGSQLHKDDYQETGVPVVNPTHLSDGRIDHESVPRISDENARRLERHRLHVDDIVVARRGQIGRMARVTESEEGWLCGTGSFLIRASHPSVDNRFLHFQLSTEPIVEWLTAHAAGAIMPNLNNVVLKQIPVFLPSVDEQAGIVAILRAIDRKTDLHRRKRAVLEELFRALLHKLMTGEVRVEELGLTQEQSDARESINVKR